MSINVKKKSFFIENFGLLKTYFLIRKRLTVIPVIKLKVLARKTLKLISTRIEYNRKSNINPKDADKKYFEVAEKSILDNFIYLLFLQ